MYRTLPIQETDKKGNKIISFLANIEEATLILFALFGLIFAFIKIAQELCHAQYNINSEAFKSIILNLAGMFAVLIVLLYGACIYIHEIYTGKIELSRKNLASMKISQQKIAFINLNYYVTEIITCKNQSNNPANNPITIINPCYKKIIYTIAVPNLRFIE